MTNLITISTHITMRPMKTVLNISSYKLTPLKADDLPDLQAHFIKEATQLGIRGTIVLAEEGINLFMAGEIENTLLFEDVIEAIEPFSDLQFKDSYSNRTPFEKLLVKIKPQLIPFGDTSLDIAHNDAPHLPPETLKQWFDEGKEMLLIDTRNHFEYEIGTFKGAKDPKTKHFHEFADVVDQFDDYKDVPVVTFCTGGIRCEKAAPYLVQKGFKEVYQLDGGILKYFEKVGGEHWEGDCFVFDERITVKPDLSPNPRDDMPIY